MKTQNSFFKLLLPLVCLFVMSLAACHKDEAPSAVPGIKTFAPTHGEVDSTVIVKGYGFGTVPTVTLNGTAATLLTATDTEIKFKVPADATAGKIVVKNGGQQYSSNTDFIVTNTWIERSSFTGKYDQAISFVYNNKLYMGLGENATSFNRDFKIFDPQTNTWSQGPVLPTAISGKTGAMCFVLNDKIYFGNGYATFDNYQLSAEWYEYNPSQTGYAAWKNLTDYPGAGGGGWAFVLNNKAYVGVPYWDNNRRLSVFEPAANAGKGQWTTVATGIPDLYQSSVFSIGNHAYICFGYSDSEDLDTDKVYRFDPSTNSFSTVASFPDNIGISDQPSFNINGKGYVIIPSGIYEYDPIRNTWTRKNEVPSGDAWGVYNAAVVNNRAFHWTALGKMYEYIPSY